VKTCVYRVAQEGLTNAWRHGGGAGQELELRLDDERLSLTVRDRGPGFAEAEPQGQSEGEGGMGLAGLKDRVESLGGRIETRNRRGGGVELRMILDPRGAE
jgi:signal transduction histidine kinase